MFNNFQKLMIKNVVTDEMKKQISLKLSAKIKTTEKESLLITKTIFDIITE